MQQPKGVSIFAKKIGMIKHKILKELYADQIAYRMRPVEWEDVVMHFNVLQRKITWSDSDFYSALEVLSSNGEIEIDWHERKILLLKKGAASFGDKKYYYEHKKRLREKILYWTKIIGVVAVVLSIVLSVLKIAKEYESYLQEKNKSERSAAILHNCLMGQDKRNVPIRCCYVNIA